MSVNCVGRFNTPVDTPEQQPQQEVKQQYNRNLLNEPIRDSISFHSRDDETSSGSGVGKALAWTTVIAGLLFVGAGFLGKNKVCDKIKNKDSWYGKALTTVTDKCYSACKSIKKFGIETWDKIKNIFQNKGDK